MPWTIWAIRYFEDGSDIESVNGTLVCVQDHAEALVTEAAALYWFESTDTYGLMATLHGMCCLKHRWQRHSVYSSRSTQLHRYLSRGVE